MTTFEEHRGEGHLCSSYSLQLFAAFDRHGITSQTAKNTKYDGQQADCICGYVLF